jgi:hypothetical protein
MPVRKFRNIEEMNEAASDRWLDGNDPRLPERIAGHWSAWRGILPVVRPRGVFKFRTIEEMNAFKEKWENARIARIREEHTKK